jgi:hypothetical protein
MPRKKVALRYSVHRPWLSAAESLLQWHHNAHRPGRKRYRLFATPLKQTSNNDSPLTAADSFFGGFIPAKISSIPVRFGADDIQRHTLNTFFTH